MMKKMRIILTAAALVALLCACNAQKEATVENAPSQASQPSQTETASGLEGVWVGDGTMDIMGLDHEVEFVEVWTINSDGTATAEKTADDGTKEITTYTYKYTDDTLTFYQDNASCGLSYILEGDTLSFRTGVNTFAEFTRQG